MREPTNEEIESVRELDRSRSLALLRAQFANAKMELAVGELMRACSMTVPAVLCLDVGRWGNVLPPNAPRDMFVPIIQTEDEKKETPQ